jgi:hypothetical protein
MNQNSYTKGMVLYVKLWYNIDSEEAISHGDILPFHGGMKFSSIQFGD